MFGLFKKSNAEICMDKISTDLLSSKENLTDLILKFKKRVELKHTHDADPDSSKLISLNGTAVHINDIRLFFAFILAESVKNDTGLEIEDYSDRLRKKYSKNVKDLTECFMFMHVLIK